MGSSFIIQTLKKMNRPLKVKTVIVPSGQNEYGRDVVRFTADYAASDLYEQCIGCYPLVPDDLKPVVPLPKPVAEKPWPDPWNYTRRKDPP